jgi:hypothetical protein
MGIFDFIQDKLNNKNKQQTIHNNSEYKLFILRNGKVEEIPFTPEYHRALLEIILQRDLTSDECLRLNKIQNSFISYNDLIQEKTFSVVLNRDLTSKEIMKISNIRSKNYWHFAGDSQLRDTYQKDGGC